MGHGPTCVVVHMLNYRSQGPRVDYCVGTIFQKYSYICCCETQLGISQYIFYLVKLRVFVMRTSVLGLTPGARENLVMNLSDSVFDHIIY